MGESYRCNKCKLLKAGIEFQSGLSMCIKCFNESSENRTINHPPHYNTGNIEVIDAIEAWGLGFSLGNVIKYVARAKYKGSEIEDLKKAQWYLGREIERLEGM